MNVLQMILHRLYIVKFHFEKRIESGAIGFENTKKLIILYWNSYCCMSEFLFTLNITVMKNSTSELKSSVGIKIKLVGVLHVLEGYI